MQHSVDYSPRPLDHLDDILEQQFKSLRDQRYQSTRPLSQRQTEAVLKMIKEGIGEVDGPLFRPYVQALMGVLPEEEILRRVSDFRSVCYRMMDK